MVSSARQTWPPTSSISGGRSSWSSTYSKGRPTRPMPSRISSTASRNSFMSSTPKASSDEKDFTGLSHIGKSHALGRLRVLVVQVDQAEARVLVDDLLLLQPAPVLVLALDDRFQAGAAQPVLARRGSARACSPGSPSSRRSRRCCRRRRRALPGPAPAGRVRTPRRPGAPRRSAGGGTGSVSASGTASQGRQVRLVQPDDEDVLPTHRYSFTSVLVGAFRGTR